MYLVRSLLLVCNKAMEPTEYVHPQIMDMV